MDGKLVKQDINFLENPLWFQDKDAADSSEGFIWRDKEGYVYRAGYKAPVKIDGIFLVALLRRSQQEGWKEKVVLSRYEVLKECGLNVAHGTYWYRRLEESLARWMMVGIEFQGTFYDGENYISINFGVIDSWSLKNSNKKLEIRFSPEWILRIKNSSFFKKLNFEEVASIRSPLATRLYEILIKSFQGRSKWEIDSLKLAKKIPMKEKHPAHIIPKITTATKRISEQTSLQLLLEVKKPKRGKAIFVFRKRDELKKPKKLLVEAESPEEKEQKNKVLGEVLELIPEKERGKSTILKMLSEKLSEQGEEYVRRNILLANKKAKTSYSGYLWKALQENYAMEDDGPIQTKEESYERKEAIPQEKKEDVPLPTLSDVLNVLPGKEWIFEELIALVGKKWREDERVVELLLDAFEEEKAEYIIWNILNANKNAGRDYAVQLKHSLKDNYGAHYREQLGKEILSSTSQS